LKAFQDRHGVKDLVVVADAGMLSAANLNALEDAGFSFIVGSRMVKAPYNLADHFERHGNFARRRAGPGVGPDHGDRQERPEPAGDLPVVVQKAETQATLTST
jgi:hypothetical protein